VNLETETVACQTGSLTLKGPEDEHSHMNLIWINKDRYRRVSFDSEADLEEAILEVQADLFGPSLVRGLRRAGFSEDEIAAIVCPRRWYNRYSWRVKPPAAVRLDVERLLGMQA